MQERVRFLHGRMFVVSDGANLPTVTLVDDRDQVVKIEYAASIKDLRDFLNDVCKDMDDFKEHQQELDKAEKRCRKCIDEGKLADEDDPDPGYSEPCKSCDNQKLAMEACERYQ